MCRSKAAPAHARSARLWYFGWPDQSASPSACEHDPDSGAHFGDLSRHRVCTAPPPPRGPAAATRQQVRSRGPDSLQLASLVLVSCAAWVLFSGCPASGQSDTPARLQLVETLRLGDETDSDSPVFGRIEGLVAIDGNGRIFVGEGQDPKVFVFDADGTLAAALGRQGDGPGEFTGLAQVHTGPGDTLFVFVYYQSRVSVFEPEMPELSYTVTVPRDSLYVPAGFIGASLEGLAFRYMLPLWLHTGNEPHTTRVVMVDRSGKAGSGSLLTLPAAETLVSTSSDGRMQSLALLPFARRAIIGLDRGGRLYSPDGMNPSTFESRKPMDHSRHPSGSTGIPFR